MSTLNKRYVYQVYRGSRFLGVLQDVIPPFKLKQDINTAFTQLTVEVAINADVADQAPEPIQAEDGSNITTETDEVITTERAPDVVGNGNDYIKIRNNNRIKVYEYSDYYPNGLLRFSGKIENWEAVFGSDDATVVMQCISEGADMNNIIIQTGTTYTEQISQTQYTDDGFGNPVTYAYGYDYSSTPPGVKIAQVFNPASGIDVAKIAVYQYALSPPRTVTLKLYQGNTPGSGTLLSTAQVNVSSSGFSWVEFILPSLITLSAGVSYYFELSVTGNISDTQYAGAKISGDVYGGGNVWTSSTGAPNTFVEQSGADLMFKVYSADDTVISPYTNVDPADMLTDIIDDYRGRGGTVNYEVGSIEDTGLSVDYEFKVATTLEGVKKAQELAPFDWYWYVDAGTSIIYFKQTPTTATHKLVRGRHIEELRLKATIEQLVNRIYFSGGDTGGGENLFKVYSDPDSIAAYGQRLERLSDNRVTQSDTAGFISNSRLDERSDELYETTVTIIDQTYDIALFKVGDTVGFDGFGTLVDNLILQIVSVDYEADKATLSLGILPIRLSTAVEQSLKDLLDIQTVDNPDAPS